MTQFNDENTGLKSATEEIILKEQKKFKKINDMA